MFGLHLQTPQMYIRKKNTTSSYFHVLESGNLSILQIDFQTHLIPINISAFPMREEQNSRL